MTAASKHDGKSKAQLIGELEALKARLQQDLPGAGAAVAPENGEPKAGQYLKQCQELLADAMESISDGFVLFDAETRLAFCNDQYRTFAAGVTDLLLPGIRFEDLVRAYAERGLVGIPEDQWPAWADNRVQQFLAGEATIEYKFSNGRWVQAIDRRTKYGYWVGIRRDFTEKKTVENALGRGERRYREVFDAAEVCLWDEDFSKIYEEFQRLRAEGVVDLRDLLDKNPAMIWDLVKRIKINGVNDATLRLFGVAKREALFAAPDFLFPTSATDMFRGQLVAIWRGESSFRAELKQQNFAGEDIWVIITMPIPSRPEDFRSIPISVVDITEQKQAAQKRARYKDDLVRLVDERTSELRQTEMYLSSAIEGIAGGFVLYDPDDRVVMCNDQYKDFYPAVRDELVPGVAMADIARKGIERGVVIGGAEQVKNGDYIRVYPSRSLTIPPPLGNLLP